MRARNNNFAAFTLVEVIASLAILGVVIVGLLTARNRATAAHASAGTMLTCTRLCASKAAELRLGLAFEGRDRFDGQEGYEWQIRVLPPPHADLPRLNAYEVTVFPPAGEENLAARCVVWLRISEANP